jgi:hypothetical protein
MTTNDIQTSRLKLVLKTPEEVHSFIEEITTSGKAELSADWLAQVEAATSADTWIQHYTRGLRKCRRYLRLQRSSIKRRRCGDCLWS